MGHIHGFGIVGCGGSAPLHAMAINSLANAELVAVQDISSDRAKLFADRFGSDWEQDMSGLLAHETSTSCAFVRRAGCTGQSALP